MQLVIKVQVLFETDNLSAILYIAYSFAMVCLVVQRYAPSCLINLRLIPNKNNKILPIHRRIGELFDGAKASTRNIN